MQGGHFDRDQVGRKSRPTSSTLKVFSFVPEKIRSVRAFLYFFSFWVAYSNSGAQKKRRGKKEIRSPFTRVLCLWRDVLVKPLCVSVRRSLFPSSPELICPATKGASWTMKERGMPRTTVLPSSHLYERTAALLRPLHIMRKIFTVSPRLVHQARLLLVLALSHSLAGPVFSIGGNTRKQVMCVQEHSPPFSHPSTQYQSGNSFPSSPLTCDLL